MDVHSSIPVESVVTNRRSIDPAGEGTPKPDAASGYSMRLHPKLSYAIAAILGGGASWTAEFFAQNLTNVLTSTDTSTNQFVPAETITRPRVLGVRVGYKF